MLYNSSLAQLCCLYLVNAILRIAFICPQAYIGASETAHAGTAGGLNRQRHELIALQDQLAQVFRIVRRQGFFVALVLRSRGE